MRDPGPVLDPSLPVTEADRVELEVTMYAIQQALSKQHLQYLKVDLHHHPVFDLFILNASWRVLARKAQHTISYPADWWQAVKERWFPAWALRRWPVQRVTLRAQEILPAIRFPDNMRELSFFTFERD